MTSGPCCNGVKVAGRGYQRTYYWGELQESLIPQLKHVILQKHVVSCSVYSMLFQGFAPLFLLGFFPTSGTFLSCSVTMPCTWLMLDFCQKPSSSLKCHFLKEAFLDPSRSLAKIPLLSPSTPPIAYIEMRGACLALLALMSQAQGPFLTHHELECLASYQLFSKCLWNGRSRYEVTSPWTGLAIS